MFLAEVYDFSFLLSFRAILTIVQIGAGISCIYKAFKNKDKTLLLLGILLILLSMIYLVKGF